MGFPDKPNSFTNLRFHIPWWVLSRGSRLRTSLTLIVPLFFYSNFIFFFLHLHLYFHGNFNIMNCLTCLPFLSDLYFFLDKIKPIPVRPADPSEPAVPRFFPGFRPVFRLLTRLCEPTVLGINRTGHGSGSRLNRLVRFGFYYLDLNRSQMCVSIIYNKHTIPQTHRFRQLS